jgi:pyruvate/2-oxoglutarate dehydrogenase complex dihydrolipoamide acyltransferase (E2) component
MTYRVEVTASTINELSGKLAALASQLKGLPATFDVLRVEASEIKLPESASAPEPKTEPAPAPEPKTEPAPEPSRTYNYKDDIMPRVLKLASKRGTEVTEGLLKTFGVKRASELDPARHGELLAAIDAAMEG